MEASPQPVLESNRLNLQKLTPDEVAKLVGANVVCRERKFYLANQSEIDLYRSDPDFENSRGLPVVICRICGQILLIIKAAHLAGHGTTKDQYDESWNGAPLVSSEYSKAHSEAGKARWTEERRQEQAIKMEEHWAGLTEQERETRIANSKAAL